MPKRRQAVVNVDMDSPSYWFGKLPHAVEKKPEKTEMHSDQKSFQDSIEKALFGPRSFASPTSPVALLCAGSPWSKKNKVRLPMASQPCVKSLTEKVDAVVAIMNELEEEDDEMEAKNAEKEEVVGSDDESGDEFNFELSDDDNAGKAVDDPFALAVSGFSWDEEAASNYSAPATPDHGRLAVRENQELVLPKSKSDGATAWNLTGRVITQAAEHRSRVRCHFAGFKCECAAARQKGLSSCLEIFSLVQLKQLSALTYGTEGREIPSVKEVRARIHAEIWALKTPARKKCSREYEVQEWKLHGQVVCKPAFMIAMGGTKYAHRIGIALTNSGVPPAEAAARRIAKEAVKKVQQLKAPATEWAVTWWIKHLQVQDFLPNEYAIQYRGNAWGLVYSQMFLPVAKVAGFPLGRRQWKRALSPALLKLQQEYYAEMPPGKTLKLVRSARHSKFPECTDCQTLRNDYVEAASKLTADQAIVDDLLQRMMAHAQDWQGDREAAMRLRHTSTFDSNSIYECDDKCGSYWQKLPIGVSGRDTKADATAVYRFSIQANVVCGARGISRFTCIPKCVKTGANFGLTNLFATIVAAKEAGRLPLHCTHLYRHTDGGSDNVSLTTHVFHWLLVYLGVFQKITWFRFKAGHSHTEVADRLFSLMKKIFEADGAHRVAGVQDIPELVEKLQEVFAKEVERFQFVFNFANWNFSKWMKPWLGTLKHISSQRVFTYTYVPELWEHGCVLVQYKERVAWKGTQRDAEWAPVVQQDREVPTMDGLGSTTEKVNVSSKLGVIFMKSPPDLTEEPEREPLHEEFNPGTLRPPHFPPRLPSSTGVKLLHPQ